MIKVLLYHYSFKNCAIPLSFCVDEFRIDGNPVSRTLTVSVGSSEDLIDSKGRVIYRSTYQPNEWIYNQLEYQEWTIGHVIILFGKWAKELTKENF